MRHSVFYILGRNILVVLKAKAEALCGFIKLLIQLYTNCRFMIKIGKILKALCKYLAKPQFKV